MDVYFSSDNNIIKIVGDKVRQMRTNARLTQKQVAKLADVALSAVSNIENGKNVSLLTLIQILRVVKSLDLLEPFYREESISPIAVAKYQKKKGPSKKRVYNKVTTDNNYISPW